MSPPPTPKRAPAATVPCSSKRRHLTTPPEADASTETWASLPQDLLQLIGWRVLAGDLRDYFRVRAVCSHWNANTVRPRGRGVSDPRFHPRRWLLLPDPDGHGVLCPGRHDLREPVRFFNLSTGAFVRVRLPLVDNHMVLDSVDGLLLLHRDSDTAIRLLHPFTGDIAELPPLASHPPLHYAMNENSDHGHPSRFRASVAVSAAGDITVMLAPDFLPRVAYATAGDQRWTLSAWKCLALSKAVSFQGKLYAMQHFNRDKKKRVGIYQIGPPRPDAEDSRSPLSLPAPEKIAECPVGISPFALHLVECGSELMVIDRHDAFRTHVLVYRLADLVSGRLVPSTSIGGHALFLEEERCVCATPNKELPSVLGNSIICMRSWGVVSICDCGGGVGASAVQYHLGSATGTTIWSPVTDEDRVCMIRPRPSPSTLIHQMCLCCCRDFWNQGLKFRKATQHNQIGRDICDKINHCFRA